MESPKERDFLGDEGVDGIRMDVKSSLALDLDLFVSHGSWDLR
jgi:hypothetical protein